MKTIFHIQEKLSKMKDNENNLHLSLKENISRIPYEQKNEETNRKAPLEDSKRRCCLAVVCVVVCVFPGVGTVSGRSLGGCPFGTMSSHPRSEGFGNDA